MTAAMQPHTLSLASLLDRLRRKHFPGARFSEPLAGVAVARHAHRNLTSAFQPIVRASDGMVAGHHAVLCAADERGRAIAPSALFAEADDAESLGDLDKLARTLHAVNYFSQHDDGAQLFMNVDARVPALSPDDHGQYLDTVLAEIDVPAHRVTLVLPDSALDDPVTFVRATISYRSRGYRILAVLRARENADLEHVFLADPNYAAIDLSPGMEHLRGVVESLHMRSIQTIARRIETEEQAQSARAAGFAFLQGLHFAPPALRAAKAAPA